MLSEEVSLNAEAYLGRFDRLVVVAPHPDDDVIGCGGTLAAAAAIGLDVAVTYVTDGSASHPGSAAFPPERLRDVREDEARAALAVLGVTAETHFLRVPDGTVAQLEPNVAEAVVAAVEHAIDGERALASHERVLLVGPWARDHHTDHVAVAALVRRACARQPGVTLLEYAVWLDELGTDRDRPEPGEGVAVALDVARFAARKSAALAAHRSQLGSLVTDAPNGFALPPALIAAAARPVERFLLVP